MTDTREACIDIPANQSSCGEPDVDPHSQDWDMLPHHLIQYNSSILIDNGQSSQRKASGSILTTQ